MTDRVYPAGKPNPPPGATAMNGSAATLNGGAATVNGGPPKPIRPRPMYRPPERRRRSCSCRKCCCLTFLYTLIALLCLLLVAAIAACIFYVLYHPKHPNFTVSSIRISRFNLSSSSPSDPTAFSHLTSHIDFTLTAKNPNKKKIIFEYDPFTVDVTTTSNSIDAGNATVPGFVHVQGNTTVIRGSVTSDPSRSIDSDTANKLKSDLGKKSGFPITVEVNTKVKVQMGKFKTKRVGIRVTCDGIHGFPPKNATSKTPTPGTTTGAKCKVDLRIKIWKFTF